MTEKQKPKVPKYKVLEKSLIGNEIHEAGAIVEYDGLPAENLEPQCDLGRERYKEYLVSNETRIAKMTADFPPTAAEELTRALMRAIERVGQAAER